MPDNRKPLIYGAFPVCRNYTVRAYLRHTGTAKWRGHQDGVRYAGALLCGLYTGHLRPCNDLRQAGGGQHYELCALRHCLTIARRFCLWVRMWVSDLTHTLTRTDFVGKVNKSPEIVRFRGFSGCGRGT